jgi:ACS family hexuronate transporter-like MFS transporter
MNLPSMTPGAPGRRLAVAVMAMLALSTFLNYVDRQILSLLAQPVMRALAMDDKAYALVVTCFMVAYTLGNLGGGLLVDRLGAVRATPVFVGAWSAAGCLSGLAHDLPQLAASRFLLGLFETGSFVAAPVVVGLFLPPHRKAFGIGAYTAAAMLGAAVSPPVITAIDAAVGWRAAFLLLGAAGLCWVAVWCMLPLREAAAGAARAPGATASRAGLTDLAGWRDVLCEPKVWGVAVGTMLSFPVWFFYLNWFPRYLTDERGLSTLQMGRRAWVVYLAAGLGSLAAGPALSWLARRGLAPVRGRLVLMGAIAVLGPVGAVNGLQPPIEVSLASAAVVAFLHMAWQVTMTSLPLELFTPRSVGKVFAVSGVSNGVGGVVSTWLVGQLVAEVSYRPMFLVMACAYAVALAVLCALLARRPSTPAAGRA